MTDEERLIEKLREVERIAASIRGNVEVGKTDLNDGVWMRDAFDQLLSAYQYWTLIANKPHFGRVVESG